MVNKLFFILILLSAQVTFSQDYTKIKVGPGPEDFVLDTFNTNERLIISCDERRDKDKTVQGDIWEYDLNTEKAKKLIRKNEPDSLDFNPHGIHLIRENDTSYLFVVNHYDKKSEIIRYELNQNELVFQKRFDYNSSINSVFGVNKGIFYITNDLKFKGAIVLYKNGEYKKLDKHIKYPNGIFIKDSTLYLTTTLSNKVYQYKVNQDYTLGKNKKVTKVKGADNIRFYNEWLITTSHYKFLKFINHFKDEKKHSPSLVYAINTTTGEKKELFNNKGDIISAASGALIYKGNLYIGQVFQEFILKKKVDL